MIRKIAEECEEEALALLRTLTMIPAYSGEEQKRAEYIKKRLSSLGAKPVIDEAGNVICMIEGENKDEMIAFAAHTDTVFETSIPREIRIEDREDGERWYCPGIGDDTANLVNMLMGLKYVLSTGVKPKYTLLFAADSCEEGLGNCKGIRKVFETYGDRIKEFYTFDLYLGQVVSGAVGSHRYKISIDSEGGHSYLAFGKPNPILLLSQLIQKLAEIPLPKEGKTTHNFGMISGGTSVNTIPQHAEVLYEFRSESQSNLEQMETEFFRVIHEVQKSGVYTKGEAALLVDTVGIRPGSAFSAADICVQNNIALEGVTSEEMLQTMLPAEMILKKMTQQNMEVMKHWYKDEIKTEACSTDANIPLSMKIPANMIGTVAGGGAHTLEEWIEPASMKTGLCIVLDILSRYM